MKYEPLPELDRAEAERRLTSGDLSTLQLTAAALPSIDDTRWVREKLETLIRHEDEWVCGNAMIALGELVRLGRIPDAGIDRVRGLIVAVGEERQDISSRVTDACGDIDQYLRHSR